MKRVLQDANIKFIVDRLIADLNNVSSQSVVIVCLHVASEFETFSLIFFMLQIVLEGDDAMDVGRQARLSRPHRISESSKVCFMSSRLTWQHLFRIFLTQWISVHFLRIPACTFC